MDWELFLEDMAYGRPALCSKLLVNAILAHASVRAPFPITLPGRARILLSYTLY
jgi:hypothetical protein